MRLRSPASPAKKTGGLQVLIVLRVLPLSTRFAPGSPSSSYSPCVYWERRTTWRTRFSMFSMCLLGSSHALQVLLCLQGSFHVLYIPPFISTAPLVLYVSTWFSPCVPVSAGFFSCFPGFPLSAGSSLGSPCSLCSPCVGWVISRFSVLLLSAEFIMFSKFFWVCWVLHVVPFVCWVLFRFSLLPLYLLAFLWVSPLSQCSCCVCWVLSTFSMFLLVSLLWTVRRWRFDIYMQLCDNYLTIVDTRLLHRCYSLSAMHDGTYCQDSGNVGNHTWQCMMGYVEWTVQ